MERANYNRGRGRGGGGGRRGGRGGGGQGGPTHAAATSQPSAQQLGNRQAASYRPPASQCVEPTRRRASAPAHVPDQPQRASGPLPGGDQRGGGSRGAPTYAAAIAQPPAQQSGNRSDYGQIGAYRPPANRGAGPTRLESGGSSGSGGNGRGVGGAEAWGGSGKAWGPPSVPDQRALEPLTDVTPDVQSLKISDESHPSSPLGSTDKNLVPVKRPDRGGRNAIRTLNLLVNIFPVKFNPEAIIIHYDVEIKSEVPPRGGSGKISKSTLRMIWDKLCSDYPTQFSSSSKTAYDGEKNIFSVVSLPTEKLKVELSDGQNTRSRSYIVTLKPANELNLCKLKDYLSGILLSIPRDILQGMDVVMKENPSRHMISVGRSFYPRECYQEDDLGHGITASRGFQQSLKPTSQGLALGLDYSVLSFLKPLPVIVFLKQHIPEFSTSDFRQWSQEVMDALTGLQVTVTHRVTEQRFTITGLTDEITRDISFDVLDPEGKDPPKNVGLVDYFKEKYGMEITYKDIPCLNLGNNRKNNVPMEFCILVEGQRYPKEYLHRDVAQLLKRMSMALPKDRKNKICEMVQAEDGPCGGDTIQNFTIQVVKNMTPVVGRVLGPPKLRLRYSNGTLTVSCVDKDKCQWNLTGKSVLDGKTAERWALLDFSASDRCRLSPSNFIQNLRNRCGNLGIRIEDPLVRRCTQMSAFSDVTDLHKFIERVIEEAHGKGKGRLQIIVCVITKSDPLFNYLKWICETQLGIITQCCLSTTANKGSHPDFVNLALKINAKLGGSNVELIEWLPPRFKGGDHIMFVGADVNHPGPGNRTCPSIAAVVATVNWPAANRYAARICPQDHRKEKILNFGSMCLDLLRSYAELNKVKPQKIVVFRDGVSEGQFDMVLNEELLDLKNAIYEKNYHPTITLVVAQKRHQTRLFLKSQGDGGSSNNVPPGTVVDTTIVHPFQYDFYLCSHYGNLGTSKVTHYHVLWDEHNFTSDQLQKLIYDLCFNVARCTKPVSLVPPVYYADLVAYRGRIYQEVLMELQSTRLVPPSASFDETFYKLHPEVENTMFFI